MISSLLQDITIKFIMSNKCLLIFFVGILAHIVATYTPEFVQIWQPGYTALAGTGPFTYSQSYKKFTSKPKFSFLRIAGFQALGPNLIDLTITTNLSALDVTINVIKGPYMDFDHIDFAIFMTNDGEYNFFVL